MSENKAICPLGLKRCLYQSCRYWSREFDLCDFEDIRERDKNSSRALTKYLENAKHNLRDYVTTGCVPEKGNKDETK